MSEDPRGGLREEIVALLARALDAVGLNGRRLLWKWNLRKKQVAEQKEQASVMLRSARVRHKMCPSCRALVPRSARKCTECGASLSGVSAPGAGRVLAQIFPGATAATSLILLVNGFWLALMMMAQLKAGDGGGFSLFGGFSNAVLQRFGAGWGQLIRAGEWWRLITPIFLHGGLIHFGFNSYVLMQLGPLVESEYGRERFWMIYLASGIVGNVAATVFRPWGGVVGASGAIFGLVGLLMVYGWRKGGVAGQRLKAFMLRYAIFMFVISLLPGISFAAHAGGFVAGAILGLIVPAGALPRPAANRVWGILAIGGVLLVLWSFYQIAADPHP